jgi:hypothetical protein
MKTVGEISGRHLGRRLRVESADGAYIEGTLASVSHVTLSPWGTSIRTLLTFEELFEYPPNKEREYVVITTYLNRSAEELPDE